jgi:hypothetical protein
MRTIYGYTLAAVLVLLPRFAAAQDTAGVISIDSSGLGTSTCKTSPTVDAFAALDYCQDFLGTGIGEAHADPNGQVVSFLRIGTDTPGTLARSYLPESRHMIAAARHTDVMHVIPRKGVHPKFILLSFLVTLTDTTHALGTGYWSSETIFTLTSPSVATDTGFDYRQSSLDTFNHPPTGEYYFLPDTSTIPLNGEYVFFASYYTGVTNIPVAWSETVTGMTSLSAPDDGVGNDRTFSVTPAHYIVLDANERNITSEVRVTFDRATFSASTFPESSCHDWDRHHRPRCG